jgi:peptide/nickel transport system permease protein
MSWFTYAARRIAFAALSVFVVISLTFLVVKTAPNTDLGALMALAGRSGASAEEVRSLAEQYRARRGLTGSLLDQYVRFVGNAAQLKFGYSPELNAPVGDVLADSVPRTLGYVIPGTLLAYALGVLAGLVSAYGDSGTDWAARVASYAGLGATTIVIGTVVIEVVPQSMTGIPAPAWDAVPFMAMGSPNFRNTGLWRSVSWKYVFPAAVLSVPIAAGLFRHTRSHAIAYERSPTAKMLDAKGATLFLRARHAVRNAALPLLSVSFAEFMSVLALGAFVVETLFRIPGVAAHLMIAVYTRDFRLLVGAAIVFAVLGIVGSLLQDLLYGVLDPRIRE